MAHVKNLTVEGSIIKDGKNIDDIFINKKDAATKEQGEKADTAIQSVKIGDVEYKRDTEVILPEYPTSLPASDTTSIYSPDGEVPVNGKAVAFAIREKADKATTLSGYGITDAASSTHQHNASAVSYDNADSGLSATKVQEAIDEMSRKYDNISFSVVDETLNIIK